MFYIRNSTLWFNHNQQQQLSEKSSWYEMLPKFCIAARKSTSFILLKFLGLQRLSDEQIPTLPFSNTVKHQEFGYQSKSLKHSQAQPVCPQGQGHRKNKTTNHCRRNDKEIYLLKLITLAIKQIQHHYPRLWKGASSNLLAGTSKTYSATYKQSSQTHKRYVPPILTHKPPRKTRLWNSPSRDQATELTTGPSCSFRLSFSQLSCRRPPNHPCLPASSESDCQLLFRQLRKLT